MTSTPVRAATAADFPAIAKVAVATGQDEEWAGSDPAYLAWLLATAGCWSPCGTARWPGSAPPGGSATGPAAVSMLCDLFVHPDAHGQGIGQAMLAQLWDGTSRAG